MRPTISEGLPPREVARRVFEAIRQEQYYIIIYTTDNQPAIRTRLENLLNERNP